MNVKRIVATSLSLLDPKEITRYRRVVFFQMTTSLLDLIGVTLIGLVALLAATSLNSAELPAGIISILDRLGLDTKNLASLTVLIAATAGFFLIGKTSIYGLIMHKIYEVLGESQTNVSSRLSSNLLNKRVALIDDLDSQNTAYALTYGSSAAVVGILGSFAIVLAESSLLLVLGVVLFFINPFVTIGSIIYLAGVALLIQRGLIRKSRLSGSKLSSTAVSSAQLIQEALASYREITITGRNRLFSDQIGMKLKGYSEALAATFFISQIPKLAYEIALVLGAGLLVGWQFVSSDQITAITTLAVFLAASSRIIPSMLRISVQLTSITTSAGQANETYRLHALISETELSSNVVTKSVHKIDELTNAMVKGYAKFEPEIEIRDVSFAYGAELDKAIANISLNIASGTSTALVGKTGSGKSTLADLILGLLKPTTGHISIDGMTVSKIIEKWPGAIGYVPQNVSLINASLRENIAFGIPAKDIREDLVWSAIEKAELSTFVSSLEHGLDTQVGEQGKKLSGGQRQRIGIARALYTSPKLLVLDEATSALDAETEAAITETMKILKGNVTIITIAHRLATVQDADLVVLLEGGKVAASGTFSEVRTSSAAFSSQADLLGLR